MKKILTSLIVVSLIIACVKSSEDKNPIKVSVVITGKNTQTITRDGDTINTYPFKITIHLVYYFFLLKKAQGRSLALVGFLI